ncbi:MAG TPA: RNA pseudouridine synthase [Saprospiraceae bacterium]|nr:RNA pseudouridine synthase [Saprospiraceae bacterium]MCB9327170.1 RNA pseudouridine synthase [Lewinellaceae bacterium]HPK09966.1 RNA pseudouridine synthase [Saprospiraceae bacterium]HPQ22150.1 RNA pseudouridine synthase [Saprospiraceae bacterium]
MIYFENEHFFVINKPAGIAVQSANPDDPTVENYIKKNYNSHIHLVNRIDQPVSGFCLIAKNSYSKNYLWKIQIDKEIKKRYIAVVEGHLEPTEEKIVLYLKKVEKLAKSIVKEEPTEDYKRCVIKIKRSFFLDNYTILEIDLKTGRYHQIRAMLSHLGHPIKGDVKYGARRKNKDRSIYLHSWKLAFVPPGQEEKLHLRAPLNMTNPLWRLVDKIIKHW